MASWMMSVAEFDALLPAARAGAGWALTRIWQAYAPGVRRYVTSRGSVEPDDLTSEVFVGVLVGLAGFEGDEPAFRGWLFTVAHRRVLDEHRRRARRRTAPASEVDDRRRDVSAEDRAVENESTAGILALLATLSPDQRDVLLLRVIADLTVEQVARALGKRTGAVKALQRRGLDSLRRVIPAQRVASPVPFVDPDAMTGPR
jgi:RNA polymerase sigma-70 factor (ECF subfamily)